MPLRYIKMDNANEIKHLSLRFYLIYVLLSLKKTLSTTYRSYDIPEAY
jgi:hypothetical protein